MKLAMMIPPTPDRRWSLARQMGVRFAIAKLAPEPTSTLPPWDFEALEGHQARYREGGFEIFGLEGDQFDMSRIKEGLPDRWSRTRAAVPARGGAFVSGSDAEEAAAQPLVGDISAERIWENYDYFIRAVLPVAEESGVRMGLHPDDPPVPRLRGVGRIFTSGAALERALGLSDSPAHGLTFCQATCKAMVEDVEALARRFGRRIVFVHIRGTADRFVETFPEDGDTDMAAMIRAYRDIGFDGPIRPDHATAA